LQKFVRGAEKYAVSTNLSRRVAAWQDRIRPILDAEEERQAFDMREYGQFVLSTMVREIDNRQCSHNKVDAYHSEKTNRMVNFQHVARDCEPFEVCRRFLATLSLANMGNVRVVTGKNYCNDGSFEFVLPDLQLELQDTTIHIAIDTYQAPSLVEP
jgi:condensin-2 complex subunit H2